MDTKIEEGGNLSSGEMDPSTGQTLLDTSMVSLVSEELKGHRGGSGRPSQHSTGHRLIKKSYKRD